MSTQPVPAEQTITDEKLEEAQWALDRAKITILTRSIFLATISFELTHFFAFQIGSQKIDTAGTDGLSVVYNPHFLMSLSEEEQIGLVAHEIWHVAFDHMGRKLDRDHTFWNEAGDYVINAMLLKAGYTLPKGGLYNPNWANMATDDVYDIIYRERPPKDPQNPGIGLDVLDPGSITKGHTGGSTADVAAAQQKITTILSKAHTASEMAGKAAGEIPGEIGRHIDEVLNPVISWNDYLQRYLSDMVKNDFNWKRPNNRYMPDFYLPSQGSPTIGDVAIAVDTSGSISKKQLQEIYSEIENIRSTFRPKSLTIIGCDRAMQEPIVLYEHDDIRDVVLTGGGGTSFKPVMAWADDNMPQVLMYFTDLEAEHFTDEPRFPTIWVCYSKHKPQGIGETVYYNPAQRPR
jgi:predicted metal-dependent peptidase